MDEVVEYTEMRTGLTDEQRDAVYEHLRKGGHPTTTHTVLGVTLQDLMYEFNTNHEFALECSRLRAKSLSELEYSLHAIAREPDHPKCLAALKMALESSLPELYNTNSYKAEEKLKKIING